MRYTFEAYDVLQIQRDERHVFSPAAQASGPWLDFMTLRSEDEGRQAAELVDRGLWQGKPTTFRIVRQFPFAVKYPHAATSARKRPTRKERQDVLFSRLNQQYHHTKEGPSETVKRLYWLLANKTGVNPASHALLDAIERDLNQSEG
jgi:hypothetical protein